MAGKMMEARCERLLNDQSNVHRVGGRIVAGAGCGYGNGVASRGRAGGADGGGAAASASAATDERECGHQKQNSQDDGHPAIALLAACSEDEAE